MKLRSENEGTSFSQTKWVRYLAPNCKGNNKLLVTWYVGRVSCHFDLFFTLLNACGERYGDHYVYQLTPKPMSEPDVVNHRLDSIERRLEIIAKHVMVLEKRVQELEETR